MLANEASFQDFEATKIKVAAATASTVVPRWPTPKLHFAQVENVLNVVKNRHFSLACHSGTNLRP